MLRISDYKQQASAHRHNSFSGVMVNVLGYHPNGTGSIPVMIKNFFFFFFDILLTIAVTVNVFYPCSVVRDMYTKYMCLK